MTDDELNAKIEDLHLKLAQSQCANSYPNQYPNFQRLSPHEHFALWDEMWELVKTRKVDQNVTVSND
jgi:hypothetical protein